jgi:phosphoribosylformylglycinamidine synthase
MKARVTVFLKKSVLDAQGQAIGSALRGHGHLSVEEVRQGKVFEMALATGLERAAAQSEIDQIARDVLSNPVIEDYRVEILD